MLNHNEASIEQCRLNILAVLSFHKFPWAESLRILACQPDRIMAEPGMVVANHLACLACQDPARFKACEVNRKLHGPTAIWTMRECVPFGSMQITGHYSNDPGPGERFRPVERLTWELDVDHANPEYARCQLGHQDLVGLFKGLATLVVHGCEVAWPGKTDPYWIRKRLLARGIQVPLVGASQAV